MSFKKIFFSYPRVDGAVFALKLAQDLKRHGFDVWIDQEDIRAGSEWDLEIENALETCDCLLFLESEKSVSSNNVLDEVYYALEQKKRVIPVIVHDSKTPYRLQRLQHIDFSVSYDGGLQLLVQQLQEAGENTSWSDTEPVPDSRPVPGRARRAKWWPALAVILIGIGCAAYLFSLKNKAAITTQQQPLHSAADVAGRWDLVSVSPEGRPGDGYLKIDTTNDGKLHINSSFQFYYPQANDTLFLQVFNGIAYCDGCSMQPEMKLTTEDAAIGSQQYILGRKQVPGKAAVRDTFGSKGFNQSIRAGCVLHFTDDKNAVIKVSTRDSITLNSGITMPPFTYVFGFRKAD